MFLKELTIANKNGLIRNIAFRKGLNLIVDDTKTIDNKIDPKSGNNVGKTTVLRLISYCLGSDGKNIYEDTEFRDNKNTIIKDFLIDTKVTVNLILVDDLDYPSKEVRISRNFLSRNEKILTINEKKINAKDFDATLKKIIFNSNVQKPTFKQIISKNIRDDEKKLTNIVNVLNHFTTIEEYEALFLFWLGINTDTHDQKEILTKNKTKEENYQKRLKKEGGLSLTEQQLNIIDERIKELEKQKSFFNLNEFFEKQLAELNNIKSELSKSSSRLSQLHMRRELILESKAELENEKTHIDTQEIELLYKKASKLIPNLQVSFQDTVKFHNELIREKVQYITEELPDLTISLQTLNDKINRLRDREKELSSTIGSSDYNINYESVLLELNEKYEKKGSLSERKSLWDESNTKLARINIELEDINEGIENKDQLIQDRITLFNQYFSKISQALYGEKYLLSSQKDDRGYKLLVTNFEGNPSTGKKKGQIAAFDFAYIQFAESVDIDFLHFIMHDQLENIHGNQLSTILIDLSNTINCQFILPIIKDKIPANLDIDNYVILRLSEDDKLFKL